METGMTQIAILGVLVGLVAQPTSARRADADPRFGTWRLNLEKSRYQGTMPPKSETRIYISAPDGSLTLTATTVLADGTTQVVRCMATSDGNEHPYTGPTADTITISAKDAHGYTLYITLKKGGTVVQTTLATVTPDRKVMTYRTKAFDRDGKPISSTQVYDKR